MEFKVGDRVRDTNNWNLGEGVIVVLNDEGAEHHLVHFDGYTYSFNEEDPTSDGHWRVPGELEPVEEQPNRTYYETLRSIRDASERDSENFKVTEPPLTPTENYFESAVHRILNGIAETVVQKNVSYGDSALNPIRVFSKADRMEQLFVRLDDKLSRVQRGSEYPGDDTLRDIIGYVTLILIARESE